jgi:hypothetical protein
MRRSKAVRGRVQWLEERCGLISIGEQQHLEVGHCIAKRCSSVNEKSIGWRITTSGGGIYSIVRKRTALSGQHHEEEFNIISRFIEW